MEKIDVSVVLNAHREGLLAHRTLRSVVRAVDFAEQWGIRCEIVVVLDCPDASTARYFQSQQQARIRCFTVELGDLGLARNMGVSKASGEYVAFVDGDDLISSNWLQAAFIYYEGIKALQGQFALHQELNVTFGSEHTVSCQIDQDEPLWHVENLIEYNYWSALVFTRRQILMEIPYRPTRKGSGFGYEDWDWNCQTLSVGVKHKVVPQTVVFIRRKDPELSLVKQTFAEGAIIRPSPVFEMSAWQRSIEGAPGHPSRADAPLPECGQSSEHATEHATLRSEADTHGPLQQILDQDWLLREWQEMSDFDPELCPTPSRLASYGLWKIPETPMPEGQALRAVLEQWDPSVSHVIFCNWLSRGGADLAVLHHADALLEAGARLLVITTVSRDSPWIDRLPPAVNVIEFGRQFGVLENRFQQLILVRALLQRQPQTVHIINSWLAYEVLQSYGAALTGSMRWFASMFANELTADGELFGFGTVFLPHILSHLTGILCDSSDFASWIKTVHGYPPEKLWTIYFPLTCPIRKPPSSLDHGPMEVLWASRFTRQKFPAMLLEIVKRVPEVNFEVFGEIDPSLPAGPDLVEALQAIPNVRLHGAYESFAEISRGADAFLYTSLWDGLPNVLIEAVANGLPVVASNVGGVSDLIHDATGYLIRDLNDPMQYVHALHDIVNAWPSALKKVRHAQELLLQRHSMETFQEAMTGLPGYL